MKKPLISVIIPVYNVEDYLERCLDSVLSNTYRNLEVVCINDGSPDRCPDILNCYAEKDDRIKVITQENHGPAYTRNAGFDHATGEYIAYIDSDDWIHPQYFELMMNEMRMYDADTVVCESKNVSEFEEPVLYKREDIHSRRIDAKDLGKVFTVEHRIWARIYKRKIHEGHYCQKIRLGDDTMLNLDILCNTKDLHLRYMNVPMYYYFNRPGSIVHAAAHSSIIEEARWYKTAIYEDEVTGAEYLLLEQAVKAVLAYRYLESFGKNKTESERESEELLDLFIPALLKSRYAPAKDKAILASMSRFPKLYRQFRIHNDPSMLEWEKSMKK